MRLLETGNQFLCQLRQKWQHIGPIAYEHRPITSRDSLTDRREFNEIVENRPKDRDKSRPKADHRIQCSRGNVRMNNLNEDRQELDVIYWDRVILSCYSC